MGHEFTGGGEMDGAIPLNDFQKPVKLACLFQATYVKSLGMLRSSDKAGDVHRHTGGWLRGRSDDGQLEPGFRITGLWNSGL